MCVQPWSDLVLWGHSSVSHDLVTTLGQNPAAEIYMCDCVCDPNCKVRDQQAPPNLRGGSAGGASPAAAALRHFIKPVFCNLLLAGGIFVGAEA